MTARRLWLGLAAAGAGGALLAAAVFQYGMGLAPCQMCYWQRYAHGAVLALALAGLALPGRILPALGALAAAASTGLAAYHTGVERTWWSGPTSCSGGGAEDLGALSGADLLSVEAAPALVRCDEIVWDLFGLTMANWNVALSLALVAALVLAAAAPRRLSAG